MTVLPDSRRLALVALSLLTLIWSYNWIVMKEVLRYSGPFEFSALRYVLGTGVLFGVLIARRVSLRPPPLLVITIIGLSQTLGFQALVQWALVHGDTGKTALLAYTMPFWTVLLAWLLFQQRPSVRLWVGLVAAIFGLVLVVGPWHGNASAQSSALAIGGGLCWAIAVVLSKRLFERGDISVLSLTAWQMLIGTIGLVALACVVRERPIEWSHYFMAALAYNGLLSSGLAWLLWSYVVSRLPPGIAGLSSLVIPIAGIGFAWLVLGEQPSSVESAGIVLILAALAVVSVRRTPTASQREVRP